MKVWNGTSRLPTYPYSAGLLRIHYGLETKIYSPDRNTFQKDASWKIEPHVKKLSPDKFVKKRLLKSRHTLYFWTNHDGRCTQKDSNQKEQKTAWNVRTWTKIKATKNHYFFATLPKNCRIFFQKLAEHFFVKCFFYRKIWKLGIFKLNHFMAKRTLKNITFVSKILPPRFIYSQLNTFKQARTVAPTRQHLLLPTVRNIVGFGSYLRSKTSHTVAILMTLSIATVTKHLKAACPKGFKYYYFPSKNFFRKENIQFSNQRFFPFPGTAHDAQTSLQSR